ncbi:hypothetical protein [Nonomuraea zeae]|uniref:WD40 repeat domain-containing protein n=1 Tax=Nonomuraea zeae TaxID=1642303 RepID=A0A5S4FSZ1_9ACTN|nr:hypothetical protein [Nonomuraea zeae]TMR23484.1 hypothetical protein ETD85_47985 [Nonomuraea zeae]
MRHSSATAALLASAVIGGLGLTPAVAHAQAGPPVARGAWIASCTDRKSDLSYPCGHWQVLLRDGGRLTVRGAATTTADGGGKEVRDTSAFAISADGRVLAYERAGDHRLVVRRLAGGKATVLPRSAVPAGTGTEGLGLTLSPTGDKVLIDFPDEARLPAKVITVATGRTTTLPAKDSMIGFSGDGGEVLATRFLSDNTTRMYAYRLGGGSIRRTPPQVVANAAATALAPDGETVAALTSGDADKGRPPRLRVYNLVTGGLSAGVDLPVKAGVQPGPAWWTADGRLRVTVRSGEEGEPAVVRVLTVDPESGAATRADSYSISKTRYTFIAAGE